MNEYTINGAIIETAQLRSSDVGTICLLKVVVQVLRAGGFITDVSSLVGHPLIITITNPQLPLPIDPDTGEMHEAPQEPAG